MRPIIETSEVLREIVEVQECLRRWTEQQQVLLQWLQSVGPDLQSVVIDPAISEYCSSAPTDLAIDDEVEDTEYLLSQGLEDQWWEQRMGFRPHPDEQ